ncbi:MAG TPA: electron transfer flavoprotein beta subunit/FixA family protein [Deltaproteobacteria bacterium]|mgnify:CR=1 FL=1|nr:electron transfer flavoprotein beta subunit/FixA family protein [Deltaproteobacteria bacterium]
MNILVCVKQVPDSADTIELCEGSSRIIYKEGTVFRMNRYDEFALEEALLIKECFPGTIVDAVSVGPDRVSLSIRKALETGADQGIHLRVESDQYLTPFARASLIAGFARAGSYDLIMAGIMAEDDMECQVGQILAEMLCLPCATSVIFQEMSKDEKTVYVEREIEGGVHECITLPMPALLTIQSGINTPRYPSLSNVLRARSQKIEMIESQMAAALIMDRTVIGLGYPRQPSAGEYLEGTPAAKASALLKILHEAAIL